MQQDTTESEDHVGVHLRELRKQRDLSLRALAARSGLAINTLSMIENGRTSPSVSTLQILARSLNISMATFFEWEPVEKKVVYVQGAQRPAAILDRGRLEFLGRDLAGSIVQPFVVTLEPGYGSEHNSIVHTGHEFIYCLSGQVLYSVDGQDYLLKSGDSIVFESHLPHHWQNTDQSPAQLILVLIPADVRDSPAERHFSLG